MKKLMKGIFRTVTLVLALLFILAVILLPSLKRAGGGIYDKTLRFHILANSDDEEDQALKLEVRDALLAFLSPRLEGCADSAECAAAAQRMLVEIEEEAEAALRARGCDNEVRASVGREYYPTRTYGAYSYPAGEYDSLVVRIGEGAGRNWWCVVFPPLCLDASAAGDLSGTGYSEEEALTVRREGVGEVRFFLLDFLAKLRRWLF